MRLRRFSVSNYRSIKTTPRIFIDNSLTIVGPNNEGKSNLVRALVTALTALENVGDSSLSRLRRRRMAGRPTSLEYEWERDCHLSAQQKPNGESTFYVEFELNADDQKDFYRKIGSRINSFLPIEISIDEEELVTFEVKKRGKAKAVYKRKSEDIAQFVGERLSINHIPAIRTAAEANEVVARLLNANLRSVTRDPLYAQALQTIETLFKPSLKALEVSLTQSLSRFLPSVKSVTLELPPHVLRRAINTVDIQIDDGQLTPLETKGDGVISLVSMALLARLQDSTASSFNTILAIEEPESHLHPRAIHAIRDVLSNIGDDYQIITTTHSPVLVDRLRVPSNIIVENSNARVAINVDEVREALGVRVSDNLAHARIIIVCEGDDDCSFLKACLPECSRVVSEAITSGDVGFYSLNGVGNLSYALSMLQQSVSTPICFLDDDAAARTAVSKALTEGSLKESEIILSKAPGKTESELEDLYEDSLLRDVIMREFKVDVDLVEKSFKKKKFSDRCKRSFETAGKLWSDSVKGRVKYALGRAAVAGGRKSLRAGSAGPIDTLCRELESLVLTN